MHIVTNYISLSPMIRKGSHCHIFPPTVELKWTERQALCLKAETQCQMRLICICVFNGSIALHNV